MIAIAVWLLIAISDGTYNRGTTTTLAQHPSQEDCEKTLASLKKQAGTGGKNFYCVPAKIITQHR